MPPFTLYWSSLDRYENCPQQFLWGRGWGTLDVGGGPGKKKPLPCQKTEHHALLGIVIQAAIERMYNDELWKHPGLRDRLLEIVDTEFKRELQRRYVDYRLAPTKDEMLKVIQDGVLGYLGTMKQHRLVGPYAKCEVELLGYLKKWLPIGGRADLIVRREDTGVTILDGKNSKRYKEKGKLITHTDPDQLRWYALCFFLSYNRMPDRLGFTYYRYPYGAPALDVNGNPVLDEAGEPVVEQGVEWVPFTRDDLKGLAERAVEARRGMDREKFPANPRPPYCRFCDYETCCPERQTQKAGNRHSKKSSEAFDGATGFIELGLG